MEIQVAVLCMQLGKCFINFLPLLFQREAHSQSSTISLLILLMTDTVITVYLLCLWFGDWLLSPSRDIVFLRFLSFQNETYRSIPLLIPWICFSEEWSRSRINKWDGSYMAETPLSVQSRLLSLTCWLIAALYGKHTIPEYLEIPPECDRREWLCFLTYINGNRPFDWMLLSIGLVLGITLSHNTMGNRQSIINIWCEEKRTFKELAAPILLGTGTIVLFYFFPPFVSVCSWSILALDGLCNLLRFQISQPISTIYSALEDVQITDRKNVHKH